MRGQGRYRAHLFNLCLRHGRIVSATPILGPISCPSFVPCAVYMCVCINIVYVFRRMGKRKTAGYAFSGKKGKRQRTASGYKTAGSSAARAAAVTLLNTRIAGFAGIENKFLDTELTTTALTASWAAFNPTGTGCTDSLSVPAVGTSESQRIGRMYTIDSVMVRGVLSVIATESVTAPINDFRARVILYWDTQTNSAEAAASLIMDEGGANDILSFRNLQNTKRFIVLFDKTVQFTFQNQVNEGGINLFASGVVERRFSFYKKFKNGIQVQCDATTADVSSCTDNNFGIAAIASATAVQSNITYSARIRFRG